MNFLAHQLLSGDNPAWRVGGFLGDFVKGPLDSQPNQHLPADIRLGIQLHRQVDSLTDNSTLVRRSRQQLGADVQRVAPIAMDMCIDHFLSRAWQRYHAQSLEAYCQQTYKLLYRHRQYLPTPAQQFLQRAEQNNLLANYQYWETIERSLGYLSQRLRKPALLRACCERLNHHYDQLERDFADYFPALLHEATHLRLELFNAAQ